MTETHDHLTELHRAHYADLVRYFVRRGVADDADDLAAEVFVIAWRKLPAALDNARPWLFGVARKVLGNFRRTHERRPSLDVPVDVDGARAVRNPSHSGELMLGILFLGLAIIRGRPSVRVAVLAPVLAWVDSACWNSVGHVRGWRQRHTDAAALLDVAVLSAMNELPISARLGTGYRAASNRSWFTDTSSR